MKTFYDYHDEKTMDKCWRMKSAVVKSILDANGTNDYELPHGYIESKPIVQVAYFPKRRLKIRFLEL